MCATSKTSTVAGRTVSHLDWQWTSARAGKDVGRRKRREGGREKGEGEMKPQGEGRRSERLPTVLQDREKGGED